MKVRVLLGGLERNGAVENILMREAIKYTQEKGWFVFPTREKPSRPFMKNGKEIIIPEKAPYIKNGFKSSSIDENQIAEWWKKYPEAGIGVDCGKSNLVVVDIDIRDGKKGFDSWMSLCVSDEGALHSMTPSGGLHVIFSGQMKSHADVKSGVDIRSKGSYFLVPPSYIYEDGQKKTYQMLDDWNRTPIEYPSSLEEKINELRGKNKKRKKSERSYSGQDINELYEMAKQALEKLPEHYCEDYFEWISVALSLKSGLGDKGFELWNQWSKKSKKYDEDVMEYKWDKMNPTEITIGSLFYWAGQG